MQVLALLAGIGEPRIQFYMWSRAGGGDRVWVCGEMVQTWWKNQGLSSAVCFRKQWFAWKSLGAEGVPGVTFA